MRIPTREVDFESRLPVSQAMDNTYITYDKNEECKHKYFSLKYFEVCMISFCVILSFAAVTSTVIYFLKRHEERNNNYKLLSLFQETVKQPITVSNLNCVHLNVITDNHINSNADMTKLGNNFVSITPKNHDELFCDISVDNELIAKIDETVVTGVQLIIENSGDVRIASIVKRDISGRYSIVQFIRSMKLNKNNNKYLLNSNYTGFLKHYFGIN